MSNKKTALLMGILAASMAEQEHKDFYEYKNIYSGLDGVTYSPSYQGVRKNNLTKKQKKARRANKQVRKAKRRNR